MLTVYQRGLKEQQKESACGVIAISAIIADACKLSLEAVFNDALRDKKLWTGKAVQAFEALRFAGSYGLKYSFVDLQKEYSLIPEKGFYYYCSTVRTDRGHIIAVKFQFRNIEIADSWGVYNEGLGEYDLHQTAENIIPSTFETKGVLPLIESSVLRDLVIKSSKGKYYAKLWL